ncbi:unnamed protein product [Closterium sp. NIES-53]
MILWIRDVRCQLSARFRQYLPVLHLHSDRGGEFSSCLIGDLCREEGITQSFTLPASPQQNGIVERHIGLVMEIARTSMIYAVSPQFLWPFAVRYAAHQLNRWPRVFEPETSPRLRWTGRLAMRRCFGTGVRWPLSAILPRTSSLLAASAVSSLAFPPMCLASSFTTPPRIASRPTRTSLLTIDPHPTSRPAPSGVSHVTPHPLAEPLEVSSGLAEGLTPLLTTLPPLTAPRVWRPLLAFRLGRLRRLHCLLLCTPVLLEVVAPEVWALKVLTLSMLVLRVLSMRVLSGSGQPLPSHPHETLSPQQLCEWVVKRHTEFGGASSGGAEPGSADSGGADRGGGQPLPSHLQETLSPQQLHEWFVRRRAGSGGAEHGGDATGGSGAGGAGAGGASAGGFGARGLSAGGTGAGGPGAGGIGAGGTGGSGEQQQSVLRHILSLPHTATEFLVAGTTPLLVFPLPDPSQAPLPTDSPLPIPSRYSLLPESLTERQEPESCASSPSTLPVRARASCARRVRPPPVLSEHTMALRPSSVAQRPVMPSPPASSSPDVPDPESNRARAASPTITRVLATLVTNPTFESATATALVTELVDFAAACRLDYVASLVTESESEYPPSIEGECALGMDVLQDRQFELECLAAAVSHLAPPEGDLDALDIPTPCSYAEAITSPHSSQWQTAMDAEMAS